MSFRCTRRGLRAVLMALAMIVGALACTAQLASAYVGCPGAIRAGSISYWNTLWGSSSETAKGVTLCEGRGGEVESAIRGYLQIVDLGDGAKIRLHAQVDPTSPYGSFSYGERNEPWTLYRKRYAEDWYSWLSRMEWGEGGENDAEPYYMRPDKSRLFSVTNAGFFKDDNNERPTLLPFPLVTRGSRSSLGVSQVEWESRVVEREGGANVVDKEAPKKFLAIGDGEERFGSDVTQTVKIETFPTNYRAGDPYTYLLNEGRPLGIEHGMADGIVAFPPEYTFGGAARRNYVGTYGDTVYIFTSYDAYTQAQASEIMQEIQPGMNVMQLDGGGSAQFYAGEYGQMESRAGAFGETRRVPNVLAVYRAR